MKKLIIACVVIEALSTAAFATVLHQHMKAQPLSMIKTVPQAATLEYRIAGQLVQRLPIAPGTYEITVRQLH